MLPRQTLPPLLFPSPYAGCGWVPAGVVPTGHGTSLRHTACTHRTRVQRKHCQLLCSINLVSCFSHLTVHSLTTVPSRHYPYTPTRSQIHFLFPPPARPLFAILSSVLWGTGAGHPPGYSWEGCYLQVPTLRFPPALFRFDTCVWAAARAIWLSRQTWPGHRCLSPPPFPPRTARMYGCLLWRVYISL